ncbi:MAG: LacI family DNA-binding transcriptional regulator [Thermomicrobiales bacterium]
MATIKEVAERAGVSPATVSRALTGSSAVGAEYRDRVVRAAEDLGYRPNRLASNLRRRQTQTIGVVVSDIENPHYTQMVRVVQDAAERRDLRVLLCNTDELATKQRSYLEVLAAERVGGVILVPSDPEGAEIDELLGMGIPVVAFDRVVANPLADAVIADNIEGTRLATEHLLRAGHRQIGFIGGLAGIQTGAERLAGYEAAMRAQGLEPRSSEGDFRITQAMDAADELLDSEKGITGLVVANNLMAIGALRALRARGVRVPGDVALVSIDDPFWAELVEPPLTTLAQPVHRMAESAANLLFERMAGTRTIARCIVFGFELRVRQSCGVAALARPGRAGP